MSAETYYKWADRVFYPILFSILIWYLPWYICILVLFPLALKLYTRLRIGVCKSLRRLEGKTVIVTGANAGIGYETAKDFAARGAKVILTCRDMKKGAEAIENIKTELGADKVNLKLKTLDLNSFASVRKFAGEIIGEEERLDILVNNAGGALNSRTITKDGHEANMQINHFAPFLLTNLLLELMRKTGNARIVNVSSQAHSFVRTFDLEDLNSEKSWSPMNVYGKTKLANILMAKELTKRLREKDIKGIAINALHPGAVRTEFSRHLDEGIYMHAFHIVAKFFYKNSVEGAQTTLHVALAEELEGISGEYFADCKVFWCSSLAKDAALARQLWDKSVKAVGLKNGETIVSVK